MKEERMEILNMVKDGTITPEEAERLLRALDEGDRSNREAQHGPSRGRRRFGPDPRDFFPFRDLGRAFSGIGRAVSDSMRSAFEGMPEVHVPPDLDGYEDVDIFGGECDFPEGATLSIRQPEHTGSRMSGGSVDLVQSSSEVLRVDTDGHALLKRKENRFVLIVAADCTVFIPSTCEFANIALFDGDVTAHDLEFPITVSTMSGDIGLTNVIIRKGCSTMSGDISVVLTAAREKSVNMSTMSGDVEVRLPVQWQGRIEANSMSGDVQIEVPGAQIEDRSGLVGSTVRARVGDESEDVILHCTTMSGDVSVAANSDVTHANAE